MTQCRFCDLTARHRVIMDKFNNVFFDVCSTHYAALPTRPISQEI
jgi:hypothetical protein